MILEANKHERSKSLFKQLNWLTISDEIEIRKCCLIYKSNNGLTPNYIDNILVRNAELHLRTTRYCDVNLVCPRYKRESEGGRTFQVSAGSKLWNTIPIAIRKNNSYNSFYKAIRSYYYNKA